MFLSLILPPFPSSNKKNVLKKRWVLIYVRANIHYDQTVYGRLVESNLRPGAHPAGGTDGSHNTRVLTPQQVKRHLPGKLNITYKDKVLKEPKSMYYQWRLTADFVAMLGANDNGIICLK